MKVVQLMGALLPSGMERMFVSASRWLKEQDVESIIVGQGSDVPFADDLRHAGFRVRIIPVIKDPGGARAWFELLREEQPDVVHIHDEAAILVTASVAKAALPRIPIVRTYHNVFSPTGSARLTRRLQALATRPLIRRRLAVSPAVQRNERRFGQPAELLLNWVDDRFWPLREERSDRSRTTGIERAAVIVGNSSAIKNQVLALRALARTDLALYFHGDEQHATVEERALLDSLEREGRLRHRGTGDPGASLVAAACFLMPSRHEGMSIALAEALAVGVPVLVRSDAGSGWAADFPSVRFLSDRESEWSEAMTRQAGVVEPPPPARPPIDLSARRGVQELTDVYRQVARQR